MKKIWKDARVVAQSQIIGRSFKHWTGRELRPGNVPPPAFSEDLYHAPFALVSHGTEADPVLNYGNAAALALWEMSWKEFTHTPSRLTAEAPNRADRASLLATVAASGFMDDYSGVRISRTGRRFKIARAIVWNLLLDAGAPCGQAAMFDSWEFL